MVTVTIENGKFRFHGTFDCGYAGLFHDDMIDFSYQDLESIRKKGLQGKDLSNCSDDEIAAEGQLRPAAQRVTVHGADQGLGEIALGQSGDALPLPAQRLRGAHRNPA